MVAEEVYIELKGRAAHRLSLKEFIQIRVYEAIQSYAEGMSAGQGESKRLHVELGQVKNKVEK